jgi:hypothetical protein
MLAHYLKDGVVVQELSAFENGLPVKALDRAIRQARRERRPLIIVAREDRHPLSESEQHWLGERFAVLRTIERPRYDHRRNRLVVYEYRPAPRPTVLEADGQSEDAQAIHQVADSPPRALAP